MEMKLYYLYDALCGWCYGFSSVMETFHAKHADTVQFEVISGGMLRGDSVSSLHDKADYIRGAYPQVEQTTGVKFGEGFLAELNGTGTAIFDSVPPSIALAVFKRMVSAKQVAYATAIQKAIYSDGTNPADFDALAELAVPLGVEKAAFLSMMHSEHGRGLAEKDFMLAQQFGVNGYPTVIVEAGGKFMGIARGYVPLDILEQGFAEAKAMALQA